jgi:hypothetical protein
MGPGALQSFRRRLVGALSLPVGPFTLGSGVAIWALFWAFRHAEGWARAGWIFAAIAPLFWATFFSTLRASAHGGAEVPAEALQHVVKPAGGAWAATALVAAAWRIIGYPLPPGELIPALIGATPRGALPPKSEPAPRKRPAFIDLDE